MSVLKTAIVSLVVGIMLAVAALLLLSAPGSAVGMKDYLKYMDGFAQCVKEKIEKK